MPSSDDRSTWRGLAERAEAICEAARHDPYDPRLDEEMQAVAGELAALHAGEESASTTLDPDQREQRATAHAAAGEAWFALNDSQQALAQFDAALAMLGADGGRSPGTGSLAAQARCGRGKVLVDLQRMAEAVAELDASIGWYTTQGDAADEAQQSLLSQALHTLGLAHADGGDHEKALEATARAVELRRRLAEREPERYRLALSRSLRNLGNWLNELGRRDEALPSRREMLELRRMHWQHEPSAAATLALAQGADTLARELVESGNDLDEALALAIEAAGRYRELDRAYHDRFAAAFERQLDYLLGLVGGLLQAGMLDRALQLTGAALDLSRSYGRFLEAYALRFVGVQEQLSLALREQGQRAEALAAAKESLGLYRELATANRGTFLPDLAASLNNVGVMSSEAGRRVEALAAAEEALGLYRELVAVNRAAFLPDLARSLNNLANRLSKAGRRAESLAAAEEGLGLRRELAALNRATFLPDLANSLNNVGITLSEAGRLAEAIATAEEALGLYRELAAANREAFLPDLARSLNNVGIWLGEAGRRAEALGATEEALGLYRELAAANRGAFLPDLAGSLNNFGIILSGAGRRAEALAPAEEALGLRRELAAANRGAFLPDLATSLHNVSIRLDYAGRRAEALAAAEEALALRRELATGNRGAFLPDLAISLHNVSISLSKAGRRAEALAAAEEALALRRELAAANRGAFLPDLARSLKIVSVTLSEAGWRAEALTAAEEALGLYRELAAANRGAFLPDLAETLNNFGIILSGAGRRDDALAAAEESLGLRRELAAANRGAFLPDLAMSLANFGIRLSEAGRRAEALAAWRESGACVVELPPDDPHLWSQLCRAPIRGLDTPQDLRDFHLRLLGQLTDHRELAWSTEHARVFLDLQGEVTARVWELLATMPADEGELLDEAVAALVAAMQSPDLARWIDARGSGGGPLARLAVLKRQVIEAEQLLAALRKGLTGGDGGGMRAGSAVPGTDEQRAALSQELDRQSAKAQALRQAFRDERARLAAEDPRFAAAFAPLGPQALRSIVRHAQGGALLCVLEFGGRRDTGSSPAEAARAVAALLHSDGRRTRLLELAEVSELAWHAECYVPEPGDRRRGPLRGAPPVAVRSASAESGANAPDPVKGITDLLAERMSRSFWAPLQRALHESGVAIERLHVCLHGTTQQLPLALRQVSDCPGVQIAPWPGLPYLRRAAMAAGAAPVNAVQSPSAPWLVGHDCDWASEQPLPMVAVEAALLRHLLQQHGQPVQAVQGAAQLHGRASALVACCHGGAEQAQFDHALHLGAEPLTVRQIVQDNIGPPLALLPACHAGRTDEDAAGNALGVAAAFMLSGTRVVVASSKAVPDRLQPWLSTLTVWHAMQGLPHHEAATLAREQFANLEFPDGYRAWLQRALPQALATIQPGGEEDEHIRGVHAQTALEQVEERWPWEGETKDLFSADPARREEATRSVVQGILKPRGGEAGARALAAEAREMAAFVFVFGVDAHSSS